MTTAADGLNGTILEVMRLRLSFQDNLSLALLSLEYIISGLNESGFWHNSQRIITSNVDLMS